MAWQLYRLTYELLSPLHIGYHKVGNVQRTRYYIPARNLWAAVTEQLTRSGFSTPDGPQGDYQKIGIWMKRHCAFSYFFISQGNSVLAPHYQGKRMYYGNLAKADFERRYLDSHVTTALDAATTSAEEGSLHEVEFIAPYPRQDDCPAGPTHLNGWVFLDEVSAGELGHEGKWRKWLGELQIGGERRYGFGRLRLIKLQPQESLASYIVQLNGDRPQVKIPSDAVLLAHAVAEEVEARGMVEPVVGRETSRNSARFGTILTSGRICWVPGSVVIRETPFQICETGIWSKIS